MSGIAELEELRANHVKQVEFRDAIIKLSDNHEFRKIIRDDFMLNDCARNARIAGDPNLPAEARADAMAMAMAAGHLQRYLSANIQMGNRSEQDIKQIDAEIAELRAEGNE